MNETQDNSAAPSAPNAQLAAAEIRLFENPFLEKLTHVHPITPLVMWTPVLIYCYYHAAVGLRVTLGQTLAMTFMAMVLWTLSEYLLHRFVFHFKAEHPFTKRLVFLFHGVHHDDPHDATRLVMPPAPALILASLFFILFRVMCGPVYVFPFFAGYIIGYLIYDYTHYAIHHFRPRTGIGRYLRKYHYTHHFKEPAAKWGVSSPIWDFVFGTFDMPQISPLAATQGLTFVEPEQAKFPLPAPPPRPTSLESQSAHHFEIHPGSR